MSIEFTANVKRSHRHAEVTVSGLDSQDNKIVASFQITQSDEYGLSFDLSAFSLNGASAYHYDWDTPIDIFDEDLVMAEITEATGYVNKEGLRAIYASLDAHVGEVLKKSQQVKRNRF